MRGPVASGSCEEKGVSSWFCASAWRWAGNMPCSGGWWRAWGGPRQGTGLGFKWVRLGSVRELGSVSS